MKHDKLRSIGHNIADSLASGVSFLIGTYSTDVFGEAVKSAKKFMTIDFLNGVVVDGSPSVSLAKAVSLYPDALRDLCNKESESISSFRKLMGRYSQDAYGKKVIVTIEDKMGRCSTDEYIGVPLKRIKTLDDRGRVRTKRSK